MRRRPPRRDPARPAAPAVDTLPGAWGSVLARFLEDAAARGDAPTTVAMHRVHLTRFVRWCAERDLHRPQEVTRPVLESYRRTVFRTVKRNGEPLAFSTQQQRLLPLKVLFRWLVRQHLMLANPAADLELPRIHRRLPPRVLHHAEVEAMLALTKRRGPVGLRDRAILETLYSTGIRRAELARLKRFDLDLKHGVLYVRHGKGGRDRYVPLGARARGAIEVYLAEVRPALVREPDDGTVFLHDYGEPFLGNRLSDLVRRYVEAIGIESPGACHLLRHAMATEMLSNGADIRYLQAILGHAQLTTTERYTHVTLDKLKSVHAATHPAERPPARREPPRT